MNFLKNSRRVIFTILFLSALSFIPLSTLRFNFDIENFFPVNDPDLDFFTEFQDRFYTQVDDEYIFIALRNEQGLFNQEFLEKVDSLSKFVASTRNILAVYSITTIPSISYLEGEMEQSPLIHIDQPGLYYSDSVNLFQSSEYGLMLSEDGKTTAITALNLPGLTQQAKDSILVQLEQQVEEMNFDQAHIAAKIKLERTYINEISRNLMLYLVVSFLLIALVLAVLFRSISGVIIPMITIMIAVCWTLALMSLLNYPLDIISSLLPPVIAVICMSDIVHLTTKYQEESRRGLAKSDALSHTLNEIGRATFFTSATTAAGFFSLCVSNVLPIRSFGFFAGAGVLMAFFIAVGTIMAIYANTPVPKMARPERKDDRWSRILTQAFSSIIRRKYWVIGLFIFLAIPSAYFIDKIEINSSLLQELPRDHPILDDYAFIENHFSGTRAFEMSLALKDTAQSFLDLKHLKDIEQLERYVNDSMNVGNLFSPTTFIKGANKALTGGDIKDYQLPAYQSDVYVCYDKLLFSPLGKDMIRYITQDGKHARIGGKLSNLTIKEFEALSSRLENFYNSNAGSYGFTYKMTGSALLIDKVSYSLIRNLFTGLAIGFCVISIIIILMFRSLKMVLIVLISNLIPLVLIAATMGALGIYLKADTAIIFAVSFGIVVDDSIHFINRYKLERSKGGRIADALKRTYLSTGKAMIITTIILLAGFVSLTFSSFGGAYYIGLLVSLCLVIALVVDLTLLPILILLMIKDE